MNIRTVMLHFFDVAVKSIKPASFVVRRECRNDVPGDNIVPRHYGDMV